MLAWTVNDRRLAHKLLHWGVDCLVTDRLDRIAPEDHPYVHDDEGPDDMPAHIKAMLTGVSLTVPLIGGRLALGTWQGVYLIEHRRAPHERQIALHLLGC